MEVFRFVMRVLNRRGLLRDQVAGVDATYLRADASIETIVRKGNGEDYKGYLRRLARGPASNPTEEGCRFDRNREKAEDVE
ncbi:MAG: hypothetical protein IPH72_35255 [Sandaracinaceae bacterium]|nr:hypothetical protein [Sandaracinaceae bacterium]